MFSKLSCGHQIIDDHFNFDLAAELSRCDMTNPVSDSKVFDADTDVRPIVLRVDI